MCDPTSNTSKCIPTEKYMDCVKDCPNGADESMTFEVVIEN